MIKVEGLKKTYSGKVPTMALRGLSFEVAAGEFLAIMGRSGSGKSTLLHQLGLIDEPSAGRILIDGTDVLKLSGPEKTDYRLRHLGYVFQEYALIGEMSALENVYLPAKALGDTRGRERAAKLLELVGLADRTQHYPGELSGGELQRVAVARALINRPKILLADEPTASLDSASAAVVFEIMQRLNKEMGQTIIVVTHELEDERFVDRVIWIEDGSISRSQAVLRGS